MCQTPSVVPRGASRCAPAPPAAALRRAPRSPGQRPAPRGPHSACGVQAASKSALESVDSLRFSSILFDSLRVFKDFHGFSPCVVLWSWCQGPSKCLEPPRGDDVRGHARTVTYAESSEVAYVSSIIIIICLLILIVITTYVT